MENELEKAAEVYANKKGDIATTKLEDAIFKQGFIDGAKWQQEQDREMEKERIIDAFDEGNSNGFIIKCGEQYYNETFKNETK